MSNSLEAAVAAVVLDDPVLPETPRAGEPGGDPCSHCNPADAGAIWSNEHWRASPRSWSPIPGGVLLASRLHVDTISDLPRERQCEFGVIAAAIEQAIMGLGQVARVHMYRWGDGCAHFHVHFIPRPLGRLQMAYGNLPLLEERFPCPGKEQAEAANSAIAAALGNLEFSA